MSSMPPPAGFSARRWQRIIGAAGVFIDKWAARAAELGWLDVEIFGCDAARPDARFDSMGLAMLLDRAEVVEIDERGADLLLTTTGARQRYRRRPLPIHTIRLWDLGRQGS